MHHKLEHGIRRAKALATFFAVLATVFLVHALVFGFIREHFCIYLSSLGTCSGPEWIESILAPSILILTSGSAAALSVICAALVYPSRGRNVPWLFYCLGAFPILTLLSGMTFSGYQLSISDWHLVAGGVSALVSGFIAAKTLINRGIFHH